MFSIHTPDWGIAIYGTDPDNADMGWLMIGSNEDSDGVKSLEVGTIHRVPQSHIAGNGADRLKIGPTVIGEPLPAQRDLDTAYFEAVDAYRDYLASETDLLPPLGLHDQAYPASWARDCLFTVWNVGTPGDKSQWVDELVAIADTYGNGNEPLVVCPLLWYFHTDAPYVPIEGNIELAANLRAKAAELGIELHMGAYYLPQSADHRRWSADLEQGATRNMDGSLRLFKAHGNGPLMAEMRQDHPAVLAEVMRNIEFESEHGIEWIYHDAPFQDWTADPQRFLGAHRDMQVHTRAMIQAMADKLTQLGGGLVTVEMARLGLNAMQSGGGGITGALIPGGHPSKAADALFHGNYLTGLAGDIVGEGYNIAFADQLADLVVCPTPCTKDKGKPNNFKHMPQLAMTAAFGRSIIDDKLLRRPQGNPLLDAAFADYQTALRNAYWVRRRTPALSTGRMLPTPASNPPKVTMYSRIVNLTIEPPYYGDAVTPRELEQYPSGLFDDIEHGNQAVLVVGNPTDQAATITYTLDAATYPNLVDAGAASNVIDVHVPPLDFAVVAIPKR